MVKLFEHQGKSLLRDAGINVPAGEVVRSAAEAVEAAERLGFPVALKAQVWVTGRALAGGIIFAETAQDARSAAARMLSGEVRGHRVLEILVEQKLEIAAEYFLGIAIDDRAKRPVLIFSSRGGTGIEEIAQKWPGSIARLELDARREVYAFELRDIFRSVGLPGARQRELIDVARSLWAVARRYEAKSAEINPLVVTQRGELVAADCRITIDDYAVFRHPELGIEIAREFDRPATELERIAYRVEANDYRGTFYFFQMAEGFQKKQGYIGFHGAGGGGSMMSMDALLARGFKLANFCDTSGNPPASKVYRAARIILAQKNIDGYFASGSGVASQEQFHSARGMVKAFLEVGLDVPAVIRLGGNAEEQAIEILRRFSSWLAAPVEAYGKDDTPEFCAGRLSALIPVSRPEAPARGLEYPSGFSYEFATLTGVVRFDHQRCRNCRSKPCISACIPQILTLRDGVPVLSIDEAQAARGRCIECLACELACHYSGNGGLKIELPISGLEEYESRG